MKHTILVIEDDLRTAEWLRIYLERADLSVRNCYRGQEGLDSYRRNGADLILLDLMLPDGDGREFCRTIRAESEVPLIMLTARSAREDRLEDLSGGADDYITKPFDPDELILRIKAVLRRTGGISHSQLTCGPMALNKEKGQFTLFGEPVILSSAQRALMATFIEHKNCILSRQQLITLSFDHDFDAYERAIDTHIQRLRRLIHRDGFKPIKTIYGEGYKLEWEDL